MTLLRLLAALLLFVPAARAQTLYAQSIQSALTPTAPGVELLLLDLRTHELLANTFADPSQPIPAGSLLKPFLAIAYARTHPAPPPPVVCHGHPDVCWKPGGHGTLTLPQAIAQSCNAYFLALARALTPQGIAAIPYLPPPPPDASPETLIGLTPLWPIAPSTLADAYAALLTAPPTPTQAQILTGMRASAAHGTASAIGPQPSGVLAKTGTAPCIDLPCKASGDGLVIAAIPAASPTLLLLVRQRATNGATAARAAGRILTRLQALHAQ